MLEENYSFHYKPEEGNKVDEQHSEDSDTIPEVCLPIFHLFYTFDHSICTFPQDVNIFDHLPSIKNVQAIATAVATEVKRYLSNPILKVNNLLQW